MKPTNAVQPPPPARERRSGGDRRRHEGKAAPQPERRRSVEPRKPEVIELELTRSQWDALHGGTATEASDRSD